MAPLVEYFCDRAPETPELDRNVGELLGVDPAGLEGAETLAAIRAVGQAEAMLHGKRLALLQHFASMVDPAEAEWTADVIAAHTFSSIGRASSDLALADTLATRLPVTWDLLQRGQIDRARAWQVADATQPLSTQQCDELEQHIYPKAAQLYPRQLRTLLNRTVAALDAEAAEERARAKRAERRVGVEPEGDGMGWLNAYLTSVDLAAIWQRLNTLACDANHAGETRSMDQLRADALRDLLLGANRDHVRAHVYVTTTAESLLGLSQLPGDVRGVGPLPAEQVRALAYDLHAAWTGVLLDENGRPANLSDRRYRFTGKLAEYIRLRDSACVYPACGRPAERCDVDHRDAYPHGPTSAGNGDTLCRRHHRMKHRSRWSTERRADGTVRWTHPSGVRHINRAPPMVSTADVPVDRRRQPPKIPNPSRGGTSISPLANDPPPF